MAIQMRRGAYAQFDPLKMRAGEWAVSTDSDTLKQQIWMCFAPGVVKRIGTIEDFDVEIKILFQSYMDDISNSVNVARGYAETASSKATSASVSATNAKTSETNAANSKKTAQSYAVGGTNSRTGEDTDNAKYYSQQASTSKTAAATSATNAKTSETNAKNKADSASTSATNAAKSESNAKVYATAATTKASEASTSATTAATKANEAKASATSASTSATNAKASETNSAKSESEAQKYAEQAKEISEGLSGALRPLGTINFAKLPSTADASSGDMYNITDQFTTNDDFKEGAGNIIPAGSNVYLTIDRYWDVLAGTPVTGVKGNSESSYRRGNVNITPANIGALSTTGEASNTTVKFTESTSRTKPTTGEKISSIVGKIVKFLSDLKTVAFTGSYNDLSNKPLSLPANGGNATTVNGHTVNADVPSGAKFTDTHVTVTDNLTSTSTANALSANQGRILKNGLDKVNQSLGNMHLVHLESQQIKGTGYSFSYIGYKTGYRLINVIVNYNTSSKGNYRVDTIQYDDTNKVYVVFLNQTLASGGYLLADLIYISE
jgi:chemotaxis protein histidine kinase CheA